MAGWNWPRVHCDIECWGSGQQKNYTCTFFIYKIGNHSEVELCVIKTF